MNEVVELINTDETFDLPGKNKSSIKIPSEIEESYDLEDRDVLILLLSPHNSADKIRVWARLTSGREIALPSWLEQLRDNDKYAELEMSIEGIIRNSDRTDTLP